MITASVTYTHTSSVCRATSWLSAFHPRTRNTAEATANQMLHPQFPRR